MSKEKMFEGGAPWPPRFAYLTIVGFLVRRMLASDKAVGTSLKRSIGIASAASNASMAISRACYQGDGARIFAYAATIPSG